MSNPVSAVPAALGLTDAQRALLERFLARDPSALARLISVVEDRRPGFEVLLDAVLARGLGAARVGVTGPPGAGKSTLVATLAAAYRARGERVGIVAVDPTSPFTGGALLGDRIRMNELATDPGIFIRSMATRGALGGLAATTREVVDVMDAFGFDRVLVETVGVGQAELEIAGEADTTVLVLTPESGDAIQAMKAGLMEIADVFVVNKADRPGADRVAREIEVTLHLRRGEALRHVPAHHGVDLARVRARGVTGAPAPAAPRGRSVGEEGEGTAGAGTGERGAAEHPAGTQEAPASWEIPVLQTVAHSGEGVRELVDAVERHRVFLAASHELERRRRARALARVRDAVDRELRRLAWDSEEARLLLARTLEDVSAGRATPYAAARRIVHAMTGR